MKTVIAVILAVIAVIGCAGYTIKAPGPVEVSIWRMWYDYDIAGVRADKTETGWHFELEHAKTDTENMSAAMLSGFQAAKALADAVPK